MKKLRDLYEKVKKNSSEGFSFRKATGVVLILILFSSCSANWHLRRAIAKDPSILEAKEITIRDTIYREGVIRKDTFITKEIDTIEVRTDSIAYRIIRTHDVIEIEAECPADTIYVEETITLPPQIKYIERESWIERFSGGWKRSLSWIGVLAILFIVIRLFRR